VNAVLREMRQSEPAKARAIEDAIERIPDGVPIRIDVPGRQRQEYWAIAPRHPHAPVVVYRSLEPEDGAGDGWLVTTLIDRNTYADYLNAERRGLLDTPFVRDLATSLAGTVSSIVAGTEPGTIRPGGRETI
jgi:hypothetical protein